MSITLASNFLNEVHNVEAVWSCFRHAVDEWVVVDTGSTDGTQALCESLGARVYQIDGVSGYGYMRTLTAHLARMDWVLIIDGDERMLPEDAHRLVQLSQQKDYDFIPLVRQHYRTADMGVLEGPNGTLIENPTPEQARQNILAHPDWQNRFFRNSIDVKFYRRVHERIVGAKNPLYTPDAPVIRHFGWLKTDERKRAIVTLCDRLWKLDCDYAESYVEENRAGTSYATVHDYWHEVPELGKEEVAP